MSTGPNSSTAGIIGALALDIIALLRKEIALAQAEASEQFIRVRLAIAMLLVASVLAIYGIGLLLSSLVDGLSFLIESMGQGPGPAHLFAGLIVTAIVAFAAAILAGLGIRSLHKAQAGLKRTGSELARDVALAREKLNERL